MVGYRIASVGTWYKFIVKAKPEPENIRNIIPSAVNVSTEYDFFHFSKYLFILYLVLVLSTRDRSSLVRYVVQEDLWLNMKPYILLRSLRSEVRKLRLASGYRNKLLTLVFSTNVHSICGECYRKSKEDSKQFCLKYSHGSRDERISSSTT